MSSYLSIKKSEVNKVLYSFLKTTKKELDLFFNIKSHEPLIFLLNSRKELDLIWGNKTEKWHVGGTRWLIGGGTKQGVIFILNPEVYTKESSHKDKNDFWKTLKHEYTHIYFKQLTDGVLPLWLNEGIASYLSDQRQSCKNPLNIFSYFNKSDKDIYAIGYFWVELLINKFGKDKLVGLIKSLELKPSLTEKIFNERFYKIYGFKFNKANLSKLID